MLVLLIISLPHHVVSWNWCKRPQQPAKEIKADGETITLVVTRNNDILYQKDKTEFQHPQESIMSMYKQDGKDIMIKADKDIKYGYVIEIMGILKGRGWKDAVLTTPKRRDSLTRISSCLSCIIIIKDIWNWGGRPPVFTKGLPGASHYRSFFYIINAVLLKQRGIDYYSIAFGFLECKALNWLTRQELTSGFVSVLISILLGYTACCRNCPV